MQGNTVIQRESRMEYNQARKDLFEAGIYESQIKPRKKEKEKNPDKE